MLPRMGIYVEILIRGTMEDLWEKTQRPELHERWDLRFSEIAYLPRPDPAQPQHFVYTTRIGFGLRVAGVGESLAQRVDSRGRRTSALQFSSEDLKSLITCGSGYWQYTPVADGIRFVTWYDYTPRFGVVGRVVDQIVFRPLLGWATAWSFDRLRLWIERGIDPAVSVRRALLHTGLRVLVAVLWLRQVTKGPGAGNRREVALAWGGGSMSLLAAAFMLASWRANATLPSARRCRRGPPEHQR